MVRRILRYGILHKGSCSKGVDTTTELLGCPNDLASGLGKSNDHRQAGNSHFAAAQLLDKGRAEGNRAILVHRVGLGFA